MSGFEVVGVLLGVIPLVFQGFLEVSRFLEEYRGIERHIWTVLKNIDKEKYIFQMAFRTLLSSRFESEKVDGLLHKLLDPRSGQESDLRFDGIEPYFVKVMVHALESSQDTLGEIRAVLIKLGPLFEKVDKPTLYLLAKPSLVVCFPKPGPAYCQLTPDRSPYLKQHLKLGHGRNLGKRGRLR